MAWEGLWDQQQKQRRQWQWQWQWQWQRQRQQQQQERNSSANSACPHTSHVSAVTRFPLTSTLRPTVPCLPVSVPDFSFPTGADQSIEPLPSQMQQPISPSSTGRDIDVAAQQNANGAQSQKQRRQDHRDSAVDPHTSATAFDSSPAEDSPVTRNDAEDGRSVTSPGSNSHHDHVSIDAAAATAAATNFNGTANPVGSSSQRKRKSGQGGRGVANLTPEQLAKKRANDREAQRNIRERTKAQIESLERTIEQLKSQQPYQELQRVLRDKEAVEAELAEVRRVLASVLAQIQPHVPSASLKPRALSGDTPPAGFASTSPSVNSSLTHASAGVPRAGLHHEHFMSPIDVSAGQLASASAAAATYSMPWQSQSNSSPGTNAGSQSQQAGPPPFAPRPRSPNGQPTLLGMASSIYRMTEGEQEALTLLRLGEQPRTSGGDSLLVKDSSRLPATAPSPGQEVDDVSAPIWTRGSMNTKATCTLDNIVITFLSDVEKRLGQGQDIIQAVGSPEPDWRFIANPDSVSLNQQHLIGPMSRFFGQVLSNRMFPDLQKPPEKVGTAWLLYTSGYWQLTRRKEDFDRIPEWLRPSRGQQTIPHGPWIDAMFWPGLRDAVLMSPEKYVFDDLFVPLTKTVSCNWPYGDGDLFETEPSGRIHISPRFLQHITKLENWTMGPEFAQAYPSLEGKFNLRDDTT